VPVELASPAWLAALLVAVPVVAVWRRWPAPFSLAQRRAALAVRLALVAALVLALAGPELSYRASNQTLVVAADLSASTASAWAQEASAVQTLSQDLPGKDQLGVVTFGQSALVEDPPTHRLNFTGFGTSPPPNYTDFESALRLAGSLIGPRTGHHILLLSDGRENVGNGVGEARFLRSEGVRVDVLPVKVPLGPDVRVDSVSAPSTVPPSTKVAVTAVLVSNEATNVGMVWTLDNNQVVVDKAVRIKPGVTDVHAVLPPMPSGFHEVQVVISPSRDTVPGNDVGAALVQVLGPQEVLVVAGQPGGGANLVRALRASGLRVQLASPSRVPLTLSGLGRWQAVALVNVSAAELGEARMEALAAATRDLGIGLSAFGGANTFGPGGWTGTPLEQALPIDMKVTNPEQTAPVAVMLVLETVESAGGDEVMRAAVRRLVANLAPQDLVGVTDGQTGIVVPLQRVGNRAKVEKEIADIPYFGDPPSYTPFLQDAARALAAHPQATKHIVMMGDGDATVPGAAFMAGLVRQGITTSALGLAMNGSPDDMALMDLMAEEGGGRFFESGSVDQIPSIFLDEQRTELQPWIVDQRFRMAFGAPSPALAGIDIADLPPLDGYVAATAKPAAEVVLSGPNSDPILAQWQYGLGQTAAWTSDTEGRWSGELLRSPLAGRLFAGIVASTLPLAADPSLSVVARIEGDQAHILAQASSLPSGASAVAHVVGPDSHGFAVPLVETAPGRFEGDVPVSQVGPYLMRVEVRVGSRVVHAVTVGTVVAYSPELRFMGTDLSFLQQLARAGGGAVLSSAPAVVPQPLPPVTVTQPIFDWLLVLAIVLLPLDVALRRLNLSRQSLAVRSAAQAPAGKWVRPPAPPRPAPEEEPVLATRLLERLRR
jgi:Ca-activated chloride channel family protein